MKIKVINIAIDFMKLLRADISKFNAKSFWKV